MPPEPMPICPPMSGENGPKTATGLSPTNGGNGTYSYYENSYYQRIAAKFEYQKINDEISEKFNIENVLSLSRTVRIADLGCATGPNTFINMQNIMEAIKHKHKTLNPNSSTALEFQVFFNDLVTNDFNTLFASLPKDKDYFAAGVPGSFRGQIFPESSLHFVYTSHSLHWLSKLPAELEEEDSPAWNKGRVHYTSAPDGVVEAYKSQFSKEMEKFLEARAKELVGGGMLVMIFSGAPKEMHLSSTANGAMLDFMASILMEMVQEGMIKESQVDSFNLPLYNSATPEEIKGLVERNGCFSIERLELSTPSSWLENPIDIAAWMMHVRAAMEGSFIKHFGSSEVVDQVFTRLTKKHLDHSQMLQTWCNQKVQLFVVLKRSN
ncbi:SAM dependent carboxyl methyltransferase [Trema orientale]|uniref:SAM dependent carboxyl methyltransferase n=1 Tax=Trema orientale TaxID=63057 RepID=A0A2P5D4D1_TREOI|nr:SAM dependent carboxyl methyltransferase [Trema orientale]